MTDVSAGFRPPCWCPSRWAPAWRLHTNLSKFRKNVSPHIFRKKNCCDLNLGESLCISTFFLFPDSRLDRLNGFYFYFDLFWMAWHWKPAIVLTAVGLNWHTYQELFSPNPPFLTISDISSPPLTNSITRNKRSWKIIVTIRLMLCYNYYHCSQKNRREMDS